MSGPSWGSIIGRRDMALGELCKATGEAYSAVHRRMHDATSDCCGAYRHTAELGWAENELAKTRAAS